MGLQMKFRIAAPAGIVGMMVKDLKDGTMLVLIGGKGRLSGFMEELIGRFFMVPIPEKRYKQKNVIRYSFVIGIEIWRKGKERIEAEGIGIEQVQALGRVMI